MNVIPFHLKLSTQCRLYSQEAVGSVIDQYSTTTYGAWGENHLKWFEFRNIEAGPYEISACTVKMDDTSTWQSWSKH